MSASRQVSVFGKRWLREAQSMLDFEASGEEVETWSFSTNSRSMLWRNGEQITEQKAGKPVLQWRPGQMGLEVAPAKLGSCSSAPWVVVRELGKGQNRLAEGDVIQLGRETLCVRQLSRSGSRVNPALLGESCMQCEESSEEQCRICLMEGCSAEDPFVTPCACSGSVARVHLGCLRQWARTKQNLLESSVERCSFQQPSCEMCKMAYPVRVERGDSTEALLELPSVPGPFLVLESAGKGKKAGGQQRQSSFHVVSFASSELASIGRGRDCSVRLDEGSMSRWHASIRLEGGEFFIEDHNSKYGTLLSMRHTWTLLPGESLPVKVGKTVLSIGLSDERSLEVSGGLSSQSLASTDGSASEDGKSDLDVYRL